MLTQIGGKLESDFTEPLGMLSDCHKRILRFLNSLSMIAAQTNGGELTPDQRSRLETALRYFREAAPKHTADEEISLFPRLRRIDTARVQAAMEQMNLLEADHRTAEAQHQQADALIHRWMDHGTLVKSDSDRLISILSELSALYDHHIAFEEKEIFPAAAEALPDIEKRALGNEMAQRRGIDPAS